ncbi:hypothetical protein, partial [Streptomyces clavuligerus]
MLLVVLLRQDRNPGIRDSTKLGTAHPDHLTQLWTGTHPDALTALTRATHITLTDTTWGPSTHLWTTLTNTQTTGTP